MDPALNVDLHKTEWCVNFEDIDDKGALVHRVAFINLEQLDNRIFGNGRTLDRIWIIEGLVSGNRVIYTYREEGESDSFGTVLLQTYEQCTSMEGSWAGWPAPCPVLRKIKLSKIA